MKKAQITTFVVVGLVVVILAGMVIYFATSTTKRQGQKNVRITQQSTTRTQQVSNFITSCLEKTTKDGVILVGRKGGHALDQSQKQYYDSTYEINIDYGNEGITTLLLDEGEVTAQLNTYILNNVMPCIGDFSTFELQGFEIEKPGIETVEVKVELLENGVLVTLDYPIEVVYTKLGEKKSYDKFNYNLDVSLSELRGIAEGIITVAEPEPISNSMTGEELKTYWDNNVNAPGNPTTFTLAYYEIDDSDDPDGPQDLLINITDPNIKIKGQEFAFWFVRDNWATG